MDNIHYDAFISYRHKELDTFVAKKIHHMLEHYRIPKKIQQKSGKKKITRVFRDQEELPLSADLSSNITTALQHSEFLILICSPESMESRWVQTEVKTFAEIHGKDRILTVLVKGEPEESFPEILSYREKTVVEDGAEKIVQVPVEPLAADVRGASEAEIDKKLKTEILRILAPMLSCSYDELRQRHREYKLKCAIGAISVVLCLAIVFSIYAIRQAAAIEAQYQNSRRNQARYLYNVSAELLAAGDREGALKTALALQTEDGMEALVPEQMYALNNALYSYQNQNTIYLNPDCELKTDASVKDHYGEYALSFSPKGSCIFLIDKLGKAYFYDSETGECAYSCKAGDFQEIKEENFIHGIMVSEQQAVLITEYSIIYLDITEHKLLNYFKMNLGYEGRENDNPVLEVKDNYIAIKDYSVFGVFDYVTGECLFSNEKETTEDEYFGKVAKVIEDDIADYELSPSGDEIAFATLPNLYDEVDDVYKVEIYSLETGELKSWQMEACEQRKICYVNDELLAVMWIPVFTEDMGPLEEYAEYKYAVYDIESQELIWESKSKTILAEYSDFSLLSVEMAKANDEMPEPMIVTSISDEMKVADALTGEELSHIEANGRISSVELIDDRRFFVATEDGKIAVTFVTYNGNPDTYAEIPENVASFLYNPDSETAVILLEDSGKILLYRTPKDTHMTEIQRDVGTLWYMSTNEHYYRIEECHGYDQEIKEEFFFQDMETKEEIGRVVAESEKLQLTLWDVVTLDGVDYAVYSASDVDYKAVPQMVYLQNIYSGEVIYKVQLENIPEHTGESYTERYDDDFQIVCSDEFGVAVAYLENENYFEIFDLWTGNIIRPFEKIVEIDENGLYMHGCYAEVSADGKYFIFRGEYKLYENNSHYCFFRIWNIETEQWEKIGNQDGYSILLSESQANAFLEDNVVIGTETMQAVIYLEENEIIVLDLLAGVITQRIPFTGKNGHDFAFFDQERYLLFYGDDMVLTMWDMQEEKVVMRDTEKLDNVNGIYTEECNRYFGVVSAQSFTHTFNIYYVDEELRFYHFADVFNGFASFVHEEVFSFGHHEISYYTDFYDYATLKARAEELLGDTELTDMEKRMYYLTEE